MIAMGEHSGLSACMDPAYPVLLAQLPRRLHGPRQTDWRSKKSWTTELRSHSLQEILDGALIFLYV